MSGSVQGGIHDFDVPAVRPEGSGEGQNATGPRVLAVTNSGGYESYVPFVCFRVTLHRCRSSAPWENL